MDKVKLWILQSIKDKPLTKSEIKESHPTLKRIRETLFDIHFQFLTDRQYMTQFSDEKYYIKDAGRKEVESAIKEEIKPSIELPDSVWQLKIKPDFNKKSTVELNKKSKIAIWYNKYNAETKLAAIAILIGVSYGAGLWRNDYITHDLRKRVQTLEDSLRFRPTIMVPQNIPAKDTGYNSQKYNDSHSIKLDTSL